MPLHLTLARGPQPDDRLGSIRDATTTEIVVDTERVRTGAELGQALAETFGAEDCTVAGRPLASLVPFTYPLQPGAVVVASGARAATGPRPEAGEPATVPALLFTVDTGPDAGQLMMLSRGTYTIGRSGCRININDPELSRGPATLTVASDRITLTDEESANGTWVDGACVASAEISTDSVMRLGRSDCRLRLGTHPVPGPGADGGLGEPLTVDKPAPVERSRLYLVTALLPLVLGIALALFTGMWFFLAFSALSAVTAVVPLVSGAKRRRLFNSAVSQAAEADQRRRHAAAPELSGIALWFLQRSRLSAAGTGPRPRHRQFSPGHPRRPRHRRRAAPQTASMQEQRRRCGFGSAPRTCLPTSWSVPDGPAGSRPRCTGHPQRWTSRRSGRWPWTVRGRRLRASPGRSSFNAQPLRPPLSARGAWSVLAPAICRPPRGSLQAWNCAAIPRPCRCW